MASIDTLICPVDCTAVLAVWNFSSCAPQLLQAQISEIWLANDGYPLTNWSDPGELTSRIDNESTDADVIRQLTVIGSLADPTVTEKKISGGPHREQSAGVRHQRPH